MIVFLSSTYKITRNGTHSLTSTKAIGELSHEWKIKPIWRKHRKSINKPSLHIDAIDGMMREIHRAMSFSSSKIYILNQHKLCHFFAPVIYVLNPHQLCLFHTSDLGYALNLDIEPNILNKSYMPGKVSTDWVIWNLYCTMKKIYVVLQTRIKCNPLSKFFTPVNHWDLHIEPCILTRTYWTNCESLEKQCTNRVIWKFSHTIKKKWSCPTNLLHQL